ncbi:MAG: 6-phosphogluconolactonase [Cyanobacteria bacterium P01_H01_bin.119]
MQPKIEILADKSALVERGLTLVIEAIRQAIAERGYCTLALAGGSTPKPLYEALAKQDLPWDKLYIFWGDERYVSVDHPDSNAGMAKTAWLDRVAIPPEQIFIVPTEAAEPGIAAEQYEATLVDCFKALDSSADNPAGPRIDIVLLGMGDDGHTASLFPGTAALKVSDRWVTVGYKANDPRITVTAPLINRSRTVIFLVAGANKQGALSQVLAETGEDFSYPARLIRPDGDLIWLLDQAAGAVVNNS